MLIPSVYAETATSTQSILSAIPPQAIIYLIFIGIFYFFIWRPHLKSQQEKQALLAALRVGDVVYTNGGIVGKITRIYDSFYQISVAANSQLYIQKEAVVNLVPKDSLKTFDFE